MPTGKGQPKDYPVSLPAVRVTQDIADVLDRYAADYQVTRSDVVRSALAHYLTERCALPRDPE